jgi:hypothetical protein
MQNQEITATHVGGGGINSTGKDSEHSEQG